MDTTHELEQIFEITLIAPVLPDIWFVAGRAYRDISAGDSVATQVLDSSNNWELALFKVVAVSTYGYLLSSLSRGMTGSLTVVAQGRKADVTRYERQLHGAKFLVVSNHEDADTP